MINTSKERVAVFLPGLYEGGAERTMLNLAEGIAARGYLVDLVLARAEGPYMEQVPSSVRLVDLNARRVLGSVPALVKYLQQERPTALLSAMFTNIVAVCARRLAGIPHRLIINEQNTLSSLVKNKNDLRWKLYPKLAAAFYPGADWITAVSQYVADDLANVARIPPQRIQVVYNPVVTKDVRTKAEASLEHPWFKEGGYPVLVAVGRLTDQKAFDVLIRAFSLVRTKRHAHLLIVGEGENRRSLQSLIDELGLEEDVSLMGFVQNPYPYISHSSLFVLPSRWEGLPTVLIEALYLGASIVATDCPGGSREILKDGRYGKLIPVDAPLCLAEAIEASLNEPRPCPPEESWSPYHLDRIVDRYMDLLLGVS
jgi:glycosyltransferase involved in cell wall biosynthesis